MSLTYRDFISSIMHRVSAARYLCLGSFPHPPPSICTRHHECGTAHQQAPSLHASSDQNVSRCQRMLTPRRRNTCKKSASSGTGQLKDRHILFVFENIYRHRSWKTIVIIIFVSHYIQSVVIEYKAIEQWAWRDL